MTKLFSKKCGRWYELALVEIDGNYMVILDDDMSDCYFTGTDEEEAMEALCRLSVDYCQYGEEVFQ